MPKLSNSKKFARSQKHIVYSETIWKSGDGLGFPVEQGDYVYVDWNGHKVTVKVTRKKDK